MATATTALLTLEEFAALPDDGMRHELSEGELIVMPPPQWPHSVTLRRLLKVLFRYEDANPQIAVFAETGFLLAEGSATVRQPDVAIVSASRASEVTSPGYPELAPLIAFEILSPSNRRRDIGRKLRQYFEAGTSAVVVIDPSNRIAHVHRTDQDLVSIDELGSLEVPEALPGWSIELRDVLPDFE